MMAAPLDRARDLLRLATNAGASENEARNAALLAARIIVKEGLLSAFPPAPPRPAPCPVCAETARKVRDAAEDARRAASAASDLPLGWKRTLTRSYVKCRRCGATISGGRVYTKASADCGVYHFHVQCGEMEMMAEKASGESATRNRTGQWVSVTFGLIYNVEAFCITCGMPIVRNTRVWERSTSSFRYEYRHMACGVK